MSFPLCPSAVRIAALAAALAIAAAGCSKKKEPAAAAEPLPFVSSFEELDSALSKAGGRMVVLDFYADWCKPCGFLTPLLHNLAAEFRGNADFYRVNVDRSQPLAGAFGVRGIPFVVFMKGDTAVYALTGVNPKERYEKILSTCPKTTSAADCIDLLKKIQ
ncbi:MAG: thioredoxin family protein [Chitinispirillaceae bacterium]|nr:thioredoxin family protein [Chitinispirillaceae bacterium]